ncbi:MAG TPA: lysophospholipid acyltransferase family protein [Candidatus Binatia bacterium]|nr:lysophospholipid acyltransferase family protein [Candidatus Binatia bacterium]
MLYALKLVVVGLITIPAALLTIFVGLFDPHGKHVYAITRFWTWTIVSLGGVALKVEGLSRLDPNRQYVFIVNHASNIDIPVLVQSLSAYQLRWLAKKELLRVPFFGWAMWAAKHITVDRGDHLTALNSLQRAKESIRAGISIVVFPEGTRSSGAMLLPFKKGGFLLAVQAATPIVPVTINGSGTLLPAGAWRLRRGTIEVVIGDPVTVEGYRPGNLRALSESVRSAIEKNLRPLSMDMQQLSRLGLEPTSDNASLKEGSI